MKDDNARWFARRGWDVGRSGDSIWYYDLRTQERSWWESPADRRYPHWAWRATGTVPAVALTQRPTAHPPHGNPLRP